MGRRTSAEGVRERVGESSFAAMLRRAREAAGLTQEQLAERAGLTPNGVGALERGGRRHPYPSTIRALADAMGMSDAERAAFAATVPKRGENTSIQNLNRLSLLAALSPLIGREDEVANLSFLLRKESVRLVTLTGPGGVGKTSLALGVANEIAGDFTDGAAFVPLAAIRDPALVASAIAQVVGVGDADVRSFVDRIAERLRDHQLLLVIDNFEHLLEVAPLVTELLGRCKGLVILATSRAALRLSGEHDVPVTPLALADPLLSDPTEIGRFAAIQLFADRATAVDPTFSLSAENAATVAAICHRLDGIPLAIELAAARSRLFPPAAFLARLAQRLPLLTGGRRDAPQRHQTMRDAIAWSHDLLTPVEQALFRRLSIFAGGFTLEAAEAVVGTISPLETISPTPFPSVLEGIAVLIEQRLLYRVDGPMGEARYTMLETIREFAAEQLIDSGELSRLGDAHTDWCLHLAEKASWHWFTVEQSSWADRLDADHENIRAALTHTMQLDDSELVSQLASRIWPYWIVRGHLWEGWRWMDQVLAKSEGDRTIERVRILTGAARFVRYLGEDAKAKALGEEALNMAESLGAATGMDAAYILVGLANTAAVRQDFEQAVLLNERALAILQPLKHADPRAAHLECLALIYLANVVVEFDDFTRATELAKTSLLHAGRSAWSWGEIECLCCLAPLALRQGDIPSAASHCREALVLSVEQRDPWPIVLLLDMIGNIAGRAGFTHAGARLIGAADQFAASMSVRPGYVHYFGREQGIASLRQVLGAADFDAITLEGKSITQDEAVSEALQLAGRIAHETAEIT